MVGFGSIAGCPKKETKKTDTGTAASNKETDLKETDTKKETDTRKENVDTRKDAKFVITVPAEYDLEIAKGKGSFDVKAVRENLTGEIKLTFTGVPKGAKFIRSEVIPAGKDSITVDVELDKGEAKAGTYDVNLLATHGELKQDVKMKVKLK